MIRVVGMNRFALATVPSQRAWVSLRTSISCKTTSFMRFFETIDQTHPHN